MAAPVQLPRFKVPSVAYHRDLTECLKRHEDGLWEWFSSDELTAHADRDARLYLLKNAVRLDPDDHPELHDLAREVAESLGIGAPLVLYQGSNGEQRNAMLVRMTTDVAIFFGGDILAFLSQAEIRALLAHEMGHFVFKSIEDGAYNVADNLLSWICQHGGDLSHQRSVRLSQLYQEIFADRVALQVCGGLDAPLSLLVKISAGVSSVSPEAYLRQAEEALSLAMGGGCYGGADSDSHPELFIRALAMRDWVEAREQADEKLRHMIEGEPRLEALDLIQQARTSELTRAVVEVLVKTRFAQSERLEIQAREYFPDFDRRRALTVDVPMLASELRQSSRSLKAYFCYVLADFTLADPDLDDLVLLEAVRLADDWEMTEDFDAMAGRDLGIDEVQLGALRKRVATGAVEHVLAEDKEAGE